MSEEPIERNYRCKDREVIILSLEACESFRLYKEKIVQVQKKWGETFIDDFEKEIKQVSTNFLGKTPQVLREEATQHLDELIDTICDEISTFKVQLKINYDNHPNRLSNLLDKMGFTAHKGDLHRRTQQGVFEFVEKFKGVIHNPADYKDLLSMGMSEELMMAIDKIGDSILATNVKQEGLKYTVKSLSAEGVKAFNTIYKQTIAICKLGAVIYADDPIIKSRFTFSHLLANLRGNYKRKL